MNNRIKTEIILSLTILILILACSWKVIDQDSFYPINSLHGSSTNMFSETFVSTTYMDETETTVYGWGLSNITLPDKNITLNRTDVNGDDLFIIGDIVYIGGWYKIYIYNVSNPSFPELIGNDTSISYRINSIYVDGGYLFASIYHYGLVIYDVSDPNNIVFVNSLSDYYVDDTLQDYHYPNHVWAVPSESGTYWNVYLWDDDHGLVSIYFSEPNSVIQIGGYKPTPDHSMINTRIGDLFIQDDIAYGSFGELIMIDISDAANPTPINTYTPGYLAKMFLLEDLIYYQEYYSTDSNRFKILNISDPLSPFVVYSSDVLTHSITSISVTDEYAYLGYSLEVETDTFAGYFDVYDVSDPSNANLIYTYSSPFDYEYIYGGYWGGIHGIAAVGTYGYMIGSQFFIIDISLINMYESEAIAQSTIIYSEVTKSIDNATISANVDLPVSTDVLYYLSADNGTHWEQVYLDISHSFMNIDSELRWKAILSTSDPFVSPMVFSISITYRIILNAVNLLLPLNESLIHDRTPYFEWSTIIGAISYTLQIDNSSSFSSPTLLNFDSITNHYTLTSELQDDVWYWRVVAIDAEGDIGIFSSIKSFQIDAPPGISSLTAPVDNSHIAISTPTFTWSQALDAFNYTLQLDTLNSFSSGDLINYSGILFTSYTITSPIDEGKWYWRVQAFDCTGNVGPFSSIYSLTIDTTAPLIDQPDDVSYFEATTGHTIVWNVNDINPDRYKVTRDTTVLKDTTWDGNGIIIDIDGLTAGTYNYTCTVYDKAGNSNSDTIMITVNSNETTNEIPFGDFFLLYAGLSILVLTIIINKKISKLLD